MQRPRRGQRDTWRCIGAGIRGEHRRRVGLRIDRAAARRAGRSRAVANKPRGTLRGRWCARAKARRRRTVGSITARRSVREAPQRPAVAPRHVHGEPLAVVAVHLRERPVAVLDDGDGGSSATAATAGVRGATARRREVDALTRGEPEHDRLRVWAARSRARCTSRPRRGRRRRSRGRSRSRVRSPCRRSCPSRASRRRAA
jgi:hypothetical protein